MDDTPNCDNKQQKQEQFWQNLISKYQARNEHLKEQVCSLKTKIRQKKAETRECTCNASQHTFKSCTSVGFPPEPKTNQNNQQGDGKPCGVCDCCPCAKDCQRGDKQNEGNANVCTCEKCPFMQELSKAFEEKEPDLTCNCDNCPFMVAGVQDSNQNEEDSDSCICDNCPFKQKNVCQGGDKDGGDSDVSNTCNKCPYQNSKDDSKTDSDECICDNCIFKQRSQRPPDNTNTCSPTDCPFKKQGPCGQEPKHDPCSGASGQQDPCNQIKGSGDNNTSCASKPCSHRRQNSWSQSKGSDSHGKEDSPCTSKTCSDKRQSMQQSSCSRTVNEESPCTSKTCSQKRQSSQQNSCNQGSGCNSPANGDGGCANCSQKCQSTQQNSCNQPNGCDSPGDGGCANCSQKFQSTQQNSCNQPHGCDSPGGGGCASCSQKCQSTHQNSCNQPNGCDSPGHGDSPSANCSHNHESEQQNSCNHSKGCNSPGNDSNSCSPKNCSKRQQSAQQNGPGKGNSRCVNCSNRRQQTQQDPCNLFKSCDNSGNDSTSCTSKTCSNKRQSIEQHPNSRNQSNGCGSPGNGNSGCANCSKRPQLTQQDSKSCNQSNGRGNPGNGNGGCMNCSNNRQSTQNGMCNQSNGRGNPGNGNGGCMNCSNNRQSTQPKGGDSPGSDSNSCSSKTCPRHHSTQQNSKGPCVNCSNRRQSSQEDPCNLWQSCDNHDHDSSSCTSGTCSNRRQSVQQDPCNHSPRNGGSNFNSSPYSYQPNQQDSCNHDSPGNGDCTCSAKAGSLRRQSKSSDKSRTSSSCVRHSTQQSLSNQLKYFDNLTVEESSCSTKFRLDDRMSSSCSSRNDGSPCTSNICPQARKSSQQGTCSVSTENSSPRSSKICPFNQQSVSGSSGSENGSCQCSMCAFVKELDSKVNKPQEKPQKECIEEKDESPKNGECTCCSEQLDTLKCLLSITFELIKAIENTNSSLRNELCTMQTNYDDLQSDFNQHKECLAKALQDLKKAIQQSKP